MGRSKNTSLMGVSLFFCSLRVSFFVGTKISVWFGVGVWLIFIRGLSVVFLFFCAIRGPLAGHLKGWVFGAVGISAGVMVPGGKFSRRERREPRVLYGGETRLFLVWVAVYLLVIMVVAIKVSQGRRGAARERGRYDISVGDCWGGGGGVGNGGR